MTERATMEGQFTYQDFDLLIEPGPPGSYRARVLRSPAGESAPTQFTPPFSRLELENFVLKVGLSRRRTRGPGRPESAPLKDFGGKLYGAVFQDELRDILQRSLSLTSTQHTGLRLRLRLADTPELAEVPWEFLYDSRHNRFLALSRRTPLVRYLDLPDPPRPLGVEGPLRVLVMISSPHGYPALKVEQEWSLLTDALAAQQAEGRVIIERLPASMSTLRAQLRRESFHVFHFVGHGFYRPDWGDGVLVMEDRHGGAHQVTGEELGGLLNEYDQTRLAILNACEGARSGASDVFAGMAQSLIQQGLPAVVAMQFEITDDAAVIFAHELYAALADGLPLEAAVAEARGAIRDAGNPTEWGTPVLYSRAPDGRLFEVTRQARQDVAALGAPEPQPPGPVRPELVLSDTVIDFGRLPQHYRSSEHRIRISNAGGGDLNAQAATSATWLKLRQADDELTVVMDTSEAGKYEGTVTIDSEGGTATIRVHAHVDPAPAASGAGVAIHSGPVPKTTVAGQAGEGPAASSVPPPGQADSRAAYKEGGDDNRLAAEIPVPRPNEETTPARGLRRAGPNFFLRRSAVLAVAVSVAVVGLVIAIPVFSGAPRTSGTSGIPIGPGGSISWSYKTGDYVASSPAVAGGTVYIGSEDHKVYALDAATGHVRWTYTTGGYVASGPTVAGGTVYIGSEDRKVYALDAATGHVRWTYTTGGAVFTTPAVASGTVYIGSDDHKVYALDAATGHLRWTYTTGGVVESSPAVAGGTVYIGSQDDYVYALDAATGHVRWTYYTDALIYASPAVAGGTVYIGNYHNKVYALDAATGHLRWTYTTGGWVDSRPAVAGGMVYIGNYDGKVYALDAATGHLRWTYTTGDAIVSSSGPAVAGGTVYFGSEDHKVYALDAATGHLRWTYTTGGWVISGPAVAGDTLYVGSFDDKVYAFR